MPAYRFTWANFDDSTVLAFARADGGPPGDVAAARAFLARAVKRPDVEFVKKAKRAIEDVWLPHHEVTTKGIVDHLVEWRLGPQTHVPPTHTECLAFIRACRNTKSVQRQLALALQRYGDADRDDENHGQLDPVAVRRFAIVEPKKQAADTRHPHAHQEEAWEQLTAHLRESKKSNVFQGMLVMPTGAGKTFTTARWLLEHVINAGGKVLWIAHRGELLTQAAGAFYELASVAKPDRLRVRVVSSQHCSANQIDPADDILICSVMSLRLRSDIFRPLLEDRARFVVVDEAHHAVAGSYRHVLDDLLARPHRRILGLTATPTRTAERERPALARMFGQRPPLYEVSLGRLIELGILARPRPVTVQTNADVESLAVEKNREHLRKFHDIDEDWLAKIANLKARNDVIVGEYLRNKDTYKKTLVFAINVAHAALLASAFCEAGVASQYVASYRPDSHDTAPGHAASAERAECESMNPADILARFRLRDGGVDVLVNVQMLTEGVDVPLVQTVFLTRPTMSEILLRQMIGRGLRGPAAGGTKDCYLVTFKDHWDRFRDWMSSLPLDLTDVPDEPEATPPPGAPTPGPVLTLVDAVPWELTRIAMASLQGLDRVTPERVLEAIPAGHLLLQRIDDGDVIPRIVPVFAHQLPCWEELLKRIERSTPGTDATAATYDDCFEDCDPPRPSIEDIEAVLEHARDGGEVPQLVTFAERAAIEPLTIAREIVDQDLGERGRSELVNTRFGSLAKAIYTSEQQFRAAVDEALRWLHHGPPGALPRGVPVFEPRPDQKLAPGNHDLTRLMSEMLVEARGIFGAAPFHTGPVAWTKHIMKGWYAFADWEKEEHPAGSGGIRVNVLLNSIDVTEETLRFLLWHEYLHLHLKGGHSHHDFRRLERLWPSAVEGTRAMLNLNERFGIQFW